MKLRMNISSQEREDFQGFPDLEKKLNRVINREHRVLPDDQEKQKVEGVGPVAKAGNSDCLTTTLLFLLGLACISRVSRVCVP